MPTLPTLLDIRDITTEAQIARYQRVAAQLPAFLAIVTPVSLRRPGAAVPVSTVEEARILLADIRRLTAREPGHTELLVLHEATTWAALATCLAFAVHALKAFHARYNRYEDRFGYYWRTRARVESMLRNIDLEEDDEDLSPVLEEGV